MYGSDCITLEGNWCEICGVHDISTLPGICKDCYDKVFKKLKTVNKELKNEINI